MPNENETQPAAVEKPAFIINSEADVITWLRARAAMTGINGLVISIDSTAKLYPVIVKLDGLSSGEAFGCGNSIDEAVKMIRPTIKTPEQLAATKREAAAKLIAEANALAPESTSVSSNSSQEAAA